MENHSALFGELVVDGKRENNYMLRRKADTSYSEFMPTDVKYKDG